MKLKLIKEYDYNGEIIPIDSIIEVEDEVQAQGLIESGIAIAYTEEVEVEEEVEAIKSEAKTIKETEIENKSLETKKEIKNMNMFGKTIKDAIETKAVKDYASTEATSPLGTINFATGLGAKCRKMPINGNLNIVYSNTMATSAGLPVIGIIGESTAAATTVPLGQYAALPAKWMATVAVPSEYIDDVAQMEAFVSTELNNQAELVIENSIINGTFSSSYGLKGVLTDTNTVVNTGVTLSGITDTDIHALVDAVSPECQRNAIFVIRPATWAQLKANFMGADNLDKQLIVDGPNKSLMGYPVLLSVVVPAAKPVIFGDFGKYLIGVARSMQVEVDRSVSFLTDDVAVKVTTRLAGGPTVVKKQYDSATYGAFATFSA